MIGSDVKWSNRRKRKDCLCKETNGSFAITLQQSCRVLLGFLLVILNLCYITNNLLVDVIPGFHDELPSSGTITIDESDFITSRLRSSLDATRSRT